MFDFFNDSIAEARSGNQGRAVRSAVKIREDEQRIVALNYITQKFGDMISFHHEGIQEKIMMAVLNKRLDYLQTEHEQKDKFEGKKWEIIKEDYNTYAFKLNLKWYAPGANLVSFDSANRAVVMKAGDGWIDLQIRRNDSDKYNRAFHIYIQTVQDGKFLQIETNCHVQLDRYVDIFSKMREELDIHPAYINLNKEFKIANAFRSVEQISELIWMLALS